MTRPTAAEWNAARWRLASIAAPASGGNRIIPAPNVPRRNLIRMTSLSESHASVRNAAGLLGLGTLYGYAAVFNSETIIKSQAEGHFREVIAPGAFAATLADRDKRVKVLYDHGMDPYIGSKPLGKLAVIRQDAVGLYVEVPLDNTSYNRDLAESLRSGALDGMSFRFSVRPDGETWERGKDGLPLRILTSLDLFELGPVTFAAYLATSAGIRTRRGFETWLQARLKPDRSPSPEERAAALAAARRLGMRPHAGTT